MTVSILRPTSTVRNGTSTIGGGAASRHAAVSDDSDTTYVDITGAWPSTTTDFGFTLPSVPSGAAFIGVVPSVRALCAGSPGWPVVSMGGLVACGDTYAGSAINVGPDAQVFVLNGAFGDADPLQLSIWRNGSGSAIVRLIEVFMNVVYVVRPVVDVTAPTGTLTETNRPTVEFQVTYDPNSTGADGGDRQIKVFTDAVYGGGGFNPDTSMPYWSATKASNPELDSGSIQTGTLGNDTYRAYVQAKDEVSGWSDWDYVEFTVNVTPPGAAVVNITDDPDNGRVSLAIVTDNVPVTTDGVLVERQGYDDTWTTVFAGPVSPSFQKVMEESAIVLGYWPLQTDALDNASPGFGDGTVQGGASFADVPGMGRGLVLDGTDDYVKTPQVATLRDSFAGKGSVALTTSDSGHAYATTGASIPAIISNRLTTPATSGAGTGYTQQVLSADMKRIGGTFVFGSGTGGSVVFISWKQSIVVGNPFPCDTGCHFGIQPNGDWAYGIWENQVYAVVASGSISALTQDDTTVYSLDILIEGDTATCYLPDGSVEVVTDERIERLAGPYVTYETYQPNAATNAKGKFLTTWADTVAARPVSGPFTGPTRTYLGVARLDNSTSTNYCLIGSSVNANWFAIWVVGSNRNIVVYSNSTFVCSWPAKWPADGTVTLWAISYDESTDTLELFLNGVSQGTKTSAATITAGSGYLNIGSIFGTYPWKGPISHTAVLDGLLSSGEHAQLAAAHAAGEYSGHVVQDYFAPAGQLASYRVSAWNDTVSDRLYSEYTEAEVNSTAGWWMKHPTNPELNFSLDTQGRKIREINDVAATVRQTELQPLGRDDVVMYLESDGPDRGSITILIDSMLTWDTFRALVAERVPIYLAGRGVDAWRDRWVVLGDREATRIIDKVFTSPFDLTVQWVEVAPVEVMAT